jgi:hypothetical protein
LDNPGPRPERARQPNGPPPQIVEKLQRLHRAAEAMQRKGADMLPIHKLMQRIAPLLQQGRADEAEKLIVEAFKLTGEDPGRGPEKPPRDEGKARPPDSLF